MSEGRGRAIAAVAITLTDAVRGNFIDDESLEGISIELVDHLWELFMDGLGEPGADLPTRVGDLMLMPLRPGQKVPQGWTQMEPYGIAWRIADGTET